MVMRKLFVVIVAVLSLALAAAAAEDAKKPEAGDAKAKAKKESKEKAKVLPGQKVFMDSRCDMCHTVYSAGVGEPPAEEAGKKVEEAEKEAEADGPPDLSEVGAGATAEWLKLYLTKEETLNEKKHMIRFKGSDEELNLLVEWLLTLRPPEEEKAGAEAAPGSSGEKADAGKAEAGGGDDDAASSAGGDGTESEKGE
jgi:cytochrome c5